MKERGRLTDQARSLRDQLENAQASLLVCAIDLDEVTLRIRQAMRRTSLVSDVLTPALDRLERIHNELKLAQCQLSQKWDQKQKEKWSE